MASSFGARLRQHREERAVELSEIAAQTKIKVSLLEGLERDDLSHWPPGIFRRAYLRAYAHAIGLNPDTIVREFLEVYPEPPEIVDPGVNEANGSSTGGPPMRLRHLVGSAVGSLSRLRRGTVVDDRVRPQGTTGNMPAPLRAPAPAAIPPAPPPEPDPAPPASLASEPPPVVTPEPVPDLVEDVPMITADRHPALDLAAAANLCTALGRVEHAGQMPALLREAARILDAKGLIVWVWDGIAEELQPVLVHGYSDKVLAHLPSLKLGADNLTAAAFRSGEALAINGTAEASGALALPLLTPGGSAGVLAIELAGGTADAEPVRAVATIFAAMLAQLVGGGAAPADAAVDDGRGSQISSAL